MPIESKRYVFSEKKKGSILALLAEVYSKTQVASILEISQTVHKNKVKTLWTTKLQTGRGQRRLFNNQDDRQLIWLSHSNRRMTSSDLQKEWQMAAGVKCTARTVQNSLLEAGLKSCKARKKPFINEKQRRARLRFSKDHKDWAIEDCSKIHLCEECMNQATYKVVLEENLLEELLEFLRQEWHQVTQHQCERLVESMPRCMKAVIDNQGYST